MNKILLTGGHAGTTALAVIEELERDKDNDIYWVGSSIAVEGKKSKTLESKLLSQKDINYFEITAGRLQRKFSFYTLLSLIKVPIGFLQSLLLLIKVRPNVLVSFGGFVSLPLVINAWILGMPIIIHEQTIAAGLANKLSAVFANKVALSREESKKYYGAKKTVVVGNPINKKILSVKRKTQKSKDKTLYVTGGSRGAQIINKVIFDSLDELTKNYNVIHQTGELDFEKSKKFKFKNYKSYKFLTPDQVAQIYSKADIVISRAGANTVAELGYLQIPTIFIPIPWTRYDEQNKNAKLAEEIGYGKIIHQNKLTKESLLKALEETKFNINKKQIRKLLKDKDASKLLSNLIYKTIS